MSVLCVGMSSFSCKDSGGSLRKLEKPQVERKVGVASDSTTRTIVVNTTFKNTDGQK